MWHQIVDVYQTANYITFWTLPKIQRSGKAHIFNKVVKHNLWHKITLLIIILTISLLSFIYNMHKNGKYYENPLSLKIIFDNASYQTNTCH